MCFVLSPLFYKYALWYGAETLRRAMGGVLFYSVRVQKNHVF